jgi:hypothetical protein
MAIAVENVTNGGSNGSASSATCNYTTSGTERVVVLALLLTSALGSPTTVTGVTDADGLTWTRRKQLTSGPDSGGIYQTLEIWWAYAAAAHTAKLITATLNQAASTQSLISYGVSGLLTPSSPWDSNASLPASNANLGATSLPNVPGVSTSAGDGILLGWYGTRAAVTETAGSGFTLAGNNNQEPGAGSNRSYMSAEYKLVAGPQVGVTVDAGPTNTPWLMIADSMAGSAAPPPASAISRGLIIGW